MFEGFGFFFCGDASVLLFLSFSVGHQIFRFFFVHVVIFRFPTRSNNSFTPAFCLYSVVVTTVEHDIIIMCTSSCVLAGSA